MELVHCSFYRTEGVDTTAWDNIIGKLHLDLILLCSGKIDSRTATAYASRLCWNAKPLENNPQMSFLGMADPNTMPSDIRVEYFFKPTYYAAAFMAKASVLFPDFLDGEPWTDCEIEKAELKRILSSCLLGCTGRKFKGHGFDDVLGLVETMEIFAEADMKGFITKYPDLCPEFTELYKEALSYIERRVSEGKFSGAWGDDYTNRGRKILEMNGIT